MDKTYRVRKGPRHSINCPYTFFWNGYLSEGTVWDISESGWRATSNHPIPPGSETAVYLALPDKGESKYLLIDGAIVRWTDGTMIGWEITKIDAAARARFERYLRRDDDE